MFSEKIIELADHKAKEGLRVKLIGKLSGSVNFSLSFLPDKSK